MFLLTKSEILSYKIIANFTRIIIMRRLTFEDQLNALVCFYIQEHKLSII